LLGAAAAAALWSVPACAQATVFSYTGVEQTYTVAAGVSNLSIMAIGGPGGGPGGSSFPGGRAADVAGIVGVTPGEVLYVEVGGGGGQPDGGFNGGGGGASGSGLSWFGGGGASDVRTLPMSDGVISLNSRLIVAAGGGAAPGGGDAGQPGGSSAGGGAGTQTSGGAGGCGLPGVGCGDDGTLGMGGAGGISGTGANQRTGGGGGGGLYGGGGGGAAAAGAVGGGGGGSSEVPSDLGTIGLANLTTAPTVDITPVPPPTCQDLALSTPFGEGLVVQLMCTEFAGRPLTFAIVGAPAHGTLSAVGATGQVTYAPSAGFSGNDSFTYDASSANGTSSVHTVSIGVGSPSVASAGHASANRTSAKVRVTCTGAAGTNCRVTVTMTVTETLAGKKHVAVSSAKSTSPQQKKVVTVGRTSAAVRAGTSQVINVPLDNKGKHLLSTRGKLLVSIVVTQTAGATNKVVSRQTLTLTARAGGHKRPGLPASTRPIRSAGSRLSPTARRCTTCSPGAVPILRGRL
jgi:hypothetical protein